MDHVSNVDSDLAELLPTIDEVEAAGQLPLDLSTPERPARAATVPCTPLAPAEYEKAACPHEEPAREPFGAWLIKQKNRGDWIDDLASAARKDPAFPKRGDVDQVRDRLKTLGADGDTYEALDDAELDWLAR